MAETQKGAADGVPGTPGIRELRHETGTEKLDAGDGTAGAPCPGIRRVNWRAEIDTSPPFGSVKEAVTRFGGSGPWLPLYKLGEAFNRIEEFDIKKVEEQATKLEKDLIVKELETLDVLEELGATKKIVEELKQQLQKEALKSFATPDVHPNEPLGTPVNKEMNKENHGNIVHNQEQMWQGSSLCSTSSSPDMILMELKQAKVNLGKTINDLGTIQSSVESLNKKMKNEKMFLERTREKLASKFAAVSAHEKAQEQTRLNRPAAPLKTGPTFDNPVNVNITGSLSSETGQDNRMVETRTSEDSRPLPLYEENGFNIKTAEMRWFAAKKMEEAAKAAEAMALAEFKCLSGSGSDRSSGFALPEPEKVTFPLGLCSPLTPRTQIPEKVTFPLGLCSPLTPRAQIPNELATKKVIDTRFQIDETNVSKLAILKRMEEATKEILHSKQVLTEALTRVENANKRQHAVEELLRRWIPENDLKEQAYNSIRQNKFHALGNCPYSPLPDVSRSRSNNPKPVLRPTVSMRDVLSRKQAPEEYATRMEMEENTQRQKVALSQMLRALREDMTVPPKTEKDESNPKPYMAQRKKFGFIQISFPLAKPHKRRA